MKTGISTDHGVEKEGNLAREKIKREILKP
jgi:hypothetical protein